MHRAHQQTAQAVCEIGAAEEFDRVAVFVGSFTEMNLPEIGCKLGLLVATTRHVPVGCHDLAPWLKVGRALGLDSRASSPPPFTANLLVEPQAEEFHPHLLDLVGLRRRDGSQKSP